MILDKYGRGITLQLHVYTPGKHLCIPYTLSRAPLPTISDSTDFSGSFYWSVVSALLATSDYSVTLQTAQAQDETLSQVVQYCRAGCPQKSPQGPIKNFGLQDMNYPFTMICYSMETELSFQLISNQRSYVHKVHEGHQGIVKCRLHAKELV